MRILLVNPPKVNGSSYIREGRCMQKSSSWAAMWMPLTLAYIASVLKSNNEVKLIDCQAENINHQNFYKQLIKFNPAMVICNTGFPSIKEDLKILETCKLYSPQIITSIFGMYSTLLKEKVFKDSKYLDYAITGEPEWVYSNLIENLKKRYDIKTVEGIIYRNHSGNILKNAEQSLMKNNINDLPFPARELLQNNKYKYPLSQQPFTLISITRGCPYNCSFCNASRYHGVKYRKREISSIIQELEQCVKLYKIRTFLFWGESFSLDMKYAHELLDAIIHSGLKIRWSTRSMIDRVDKDLLYKMKKAGCTSISVGIETVNQHALDSINKSIKVTSFTNQLQLISDAGIISVGHFIFGLPLDNKDSIKQAIRFALKSKLDFAQFYCATPYPGTPFYEQANENKWIESYDYSKYHLANSVLHNSELTAKEINKLRNRAYLRFYLRPRIFLHSLRYLKSIKALMLPFKFSDWARNRSHPKQPNTFATPTSQR